LGQRRGGALANVPDSEGVDEPVEAGALARLDSVDGVLRRLLGHAFEPSKLLDCQ